MQEQVPREETEEERETRVARTMQSSLRLEYFQMLVAYELHQQVWKISRERMEKKEVELTHKCAVMTAQVDAMTAFTAQLEHERESLIAETSSLEHMLEQLQLQETGKIPSPEVVQTMELNIRNGELEQEIEDLVVENEELRQARVVLEDELDTVQHALDEFVEFDVDDGAYAIDVFSTAFLGSFVHRGSIDKSAPNARELLLAKIQHKCAQLEDDLAQEQERAQYVESEIAQFKQQMHLAAAASKREDAFLSGEKPPQFIFLENRIAYLRKSLVRLSCATSVCHTSRLAPPHANYQCPVCTARDRRSDRQGVERRRPRSCRQPLDPTRSAQGRPQERARRDAAHGAGLECPRRARAPVVAHAASDGRARGPERCLGH